MATGISANRLELLQIADAVAREKSIEKEIVIEAIEEAIQKGAKAKYGAEHDIRASIDTKTGELTLKRFTTIVSDDEDLSVEEGMEPKVGLKHLSDALRRYPDAEVGKVYQEVLPPFEFGRVQTQMARQVASVSSRSSRTAPAKSSTAPSNASNTATPLSTLAAARVSCAVTSRSRVRTSTSATGFAATSTTCGEKLKARRSC
jgi:hypothetical protein